MTDPSEETSGIAKKEEELVRHKWQEDFECRLWVRSLGQEETERVVATAGEMLAEQIILGHIKRSWIYPNVNEVFEARVGKKLQGPVNISKLFNSTQYEFGRLKDWKLNDN